MKKKCSATISDFNSIFFFLIFHDIRKTEKGAMREETNTFPEQYSLSECSNLVYGRSSKIFREMIHQFRQSMLRTVFPLFFIVNCIVKNINLSMKRGSRIPPTLEFKTGKYQTNY